ENMAELTDALPAVQAIHVEAIGENPHEADLVGIAFYAIGSAGGAAGGENGGAASGAKGAAGGAKSAEGGAEGADDESGQDRAFYADWETLASDSGAPVRAWLADKDAPKTMHDAHKAELALGWR